MDSKSYMMSVAGLPITPVLSWGWVLPGLRGGRVVWWRGFSSRENFLTYNLHHVTCNGA
jgi:hypothetical protein